MGVESNAQQKLENLSKSILEFSSEIQVDTIFTSFQAALEYLFLASQKERLLLVIDEYPYVARSSKSLASTLQLLIDKYKDTSRLMLKQTGKIVVKFQRRGKPTNSALLESHYQSEHLQDIGMSRPICCYTSK